MRRSLLGLLSLCLAALLIPATPARAERQSFNAWKAFCSGGLCVAETVTTGGSVRLRLTRGSGGAEPWVISFTDVQHDVAPGSPIAVIVDGRPSIGFAPQSGYRVMADHLALSEPVLTDALFAALRRGRQATLAFKHARGFGLKLGFPLDGLEAALRWIDDRQGRTGERPVVGGPPPAAPPAASLPSVPDTPPAPATQTAQQPPPASAPDRQAEAPKPPLTIAAPVERLHRADRECRDYVAPHLQEARVSDRLDEHRTLYLLPCFAGAYNVVYRVYSFDRRYPDEVKPDTFAAFTDELGWYGKDSLINIDYDAKTKTLTAFEKGRGLGDCGAQPVYRWVDGFWRMLEYRYWGQCDGSRMPEQWPVVFQHPDRKAE